MKRMMIKLQKELEAVDKELTQLPKGYLVKRRAFYSHVVDGKAIGITKNGDLIRLLCRKRYLLERKKQLESKLSIISQTVEKFDVTTPKETIKSFSNSYQGLPDSHFYHSSIKEWLEKPYKKNPYPVEVGGSFFSNNGIRLRSKSEVLIANQLEKYNIPYRNDAAFILGGQTKYPDFMIKNPYTGITTIWEHFGALHQPGYEQKMNEKMELYLKHGYIPFENLIYTLEFDVKNPRRLQYLIEKIVLKT